MNIKYFKYLMNTNENTLLSDEQYSQINSLGNTDQAIREYGLSCQIMITPDNKEVLSCFYQSNYPQEIGVNHFEITTTGISQINTIRQYISFDGAIVIKSMVSVDKKNTLICLIDGSSNGNCLKYNIELNQFSEISTYLNGCSNKANGMNVYYFKEKNEYMFMCNNYNNELKKVTFDINIVANTDNDPTTIYKYGGACYVVTTFSVIYIPGDYDYSMINDCQGNSGYTIGKIHISNLIGDKN